MKMRSLFESYNDDELEILNIKDINLFVLVADTMPDFSLLFQLLNDSDPRILHSYYSDMDLYDLTNPNQLEKDKYLHFIRFLNHL